MARHNVMIDLENISRYRENNRVEAKKALGGLPKSIWETYSAFANTLGGIILLGVVENADLSFGTVDLPDPEKLIAEFREALGDPKKVSADLLSRGDVYAAEANGDHIVVINVPRAERRLRPVYVDGDPRNTYRRSGEGDYRCSQEEYDAMVRDAALKTQDMLLLRGSDLSVFDPGSLEDYRRRLNALRPGHFPEGQDCAAFLESIGAAGVGGDGETHPTCAGLLMFGSYSAIVREFGGFRLRFRADTETGTGEDEEGMNVFGFWSRVSGELASGFPDPVSGALGEALVNCLVNADYRGRGGVSIIKSPGSVVFENPGGMRVCVSDAMSGGVSDPRNSALSDMFALIGAGRHEGSGIPGIFRVWRERHYGTPVVSESFDPDRVTFTLPLTQSAFSERRRPLGLRERSAAKDGIAVFLTDRPDGKASEIAEYLGLGISCARRLLKELVGEGIVEVFGAGRSTRYRLRR